MGLQLLQDAFDSAKATQIAIPQLRQIESGKIISEFSKIVSHTSKKSRSWRLTIKRFVDEISSASKYYVEQGGNISEIIDDLEKLRSEVAARVEKVSALKQRSDQIAEEAHIEVRTNFGSDAEKYIKYSHEMQNFISEDLELSSDFLDFLTIYLAEADPMARGGPTFEDAESLIDYLSR